MTVSWATTWTTPTTLMYLSIVHPLTGGSLVAATLPLQPLLDASQVGKAPLLTAMKSTPSAVFEGCPTARAKPRQFQPRVRRTQDFSHLSGAESAVCKKQIRALSQNINRGNHPNSQASTLRTSRRNRVKRILLQTI